MEFPFNVNNLFGSEICRLDETLTPYRTSPSNIREYKTQVCQVLDKMGEASAKAQGLGGSITSGHKLQISDHHAYVMVDSDANNGRGSVIGFIRVGHKRLFIYDTHGSQHEMEPLCALDFYVHESRQRTGCGRKLFEFMLKAEGIKPHQLAIDRPSHKFLSFLNKHYNLKATVPQVNNFVVFDGYFRDKPANAVLDRRKGGHKPPAHPYKRLGGRGAESDLERVSRLIERPPSGSRVPLTELEHQKASGSGVLSDLGPQFGSLTLLSWPDDTSDFSQSHEKEVLSNVSVRGAIPREGSGQSSSSRNTQSPLYPETNRPGSKAMGAQSSRYSRYGNHGTPSPAPPSDTVEKLDVTRKVIGGKDPPLLRRDGPPSDYLTMARGTPTPGESQPRHGGHRGGQPGVTATRTSPEKPVAAAPHLTTYTATATRPPLHHGQSSAWNVFGVPPNPRTSPTRPTHRHLNNRLW